MPFEAGREGTKALGKAELLTKSREERAQREAARTRAKAALLVRLSLVWLFCPLAPKPTGGGHATQLKIRLTHRQRLLDRAFWPPWLRAHPKRRRLNPVGTTGATSVAGAAGSGGVASGATAAMGRAFHVAAYCRCSPTANPSRVRRYAAAAAFPALAATCRCVSVAMSHIIR
jgi:hypothetical protein